MDWKARCIQAMTEENDARARLPDLLQAESLSLADWKDRCGGAGLKHGYTTLLDSTRIDPLAYWFQELGGEFSEKVELRVERHNRSHRLASITVENGGRVRMAAEIQEDALVFSGTWSRCPIPVLDKIDALVVTIVGELPRATPPAEERLDAAIHGTPGKGLRCAACRRRIDSDPFLAILAGSAVVGELHLACANTEARDLLAAALARVPHADRRSALVPYLSAGAVLKKGPLVRCTACRKAIRKGSLRLHNGEQVLHEDCARTVCPDALRAAQAGAST